MSELVPEFDDHVPQDDVPDTEELDSNATHTDISDEDGNV